MSSAHYSQMVFCDFDGTITVNETLRMVFKHFLGGAGARIIGQLDDKQITLRECLQQLVALLPSKQKQEIIAYIEHEAIRDGFEEFLQYLNNQNIPFVVISSGFGFYIEHMLSRWQHLIHDIRALDVQTDNQFMHLELKHDHDFEAMPKEWVMNEYAYDQSIAIGDALSDFQMAEAANVVFARNQLLHEMRQREIPVNEYSDFYDILNSMQKKNFVSAK